MAVNDLWWSSPRFHRAMLCWFGSLVLAGTILVVGFRMPWVPLGLAGAITLLLTTIRYWLAYRKVKSQDR